MYWIILWILLVLGLGFCLWFLWKHVPRYAVLPVLLTVAVNGLAYYMPKLIPTGIPPVYMGLPIDESIPFCPEFIYIYVLAYFQWAMGWMLLARQERSFMNRRLAGEWISKGICCLFFILLPTIMTRPVPQGDSFAAFLTRCIYKSDAPKNLLPSIHCLESWLCFRNALRFKGVPRWYLPLTALMTLLVFASTLLVKQHVLVDVPAGILAAELGLFLANKCRLGGLIERLEAPFLKKQAA